MKLSEVSSNIIDIIRIISAGMVLCGHIWNEELVQIGIRLEIQNAGVVILFVLAGFLMAVSLKNHNIDNNYTIGKLIKSRLIRLMPGLIIALLFISIIDAVHLYISPASYLYQDTFDIWHFCGNLCFVQDYPLIGDYIMAYGSGRPLWTLSLEFWLYVGVGVIFLWINNGCILRWNEYVLLGFSLIPVISNISSYSRGGGLTIAFCFGFLTSFIFERIPLYLSVLGSIITTFILFAYVFWLENAYTIWFFFIIAIFIGFVLRIGNSIKANRIKVLASVSGYTYLLYLTHYSIMELFCRANLMRNITINRILTVIISNFLAIILFYFVEKPFRKFISRKISNLF